MSQFVAGIDVGGTFTDIAVWDAESAQMRVHKLLSTPNDPSEAMLSGLRALGVDPNAVIHATTLVINAIVERKGSRTALITTDGYRDVIEIGKELRYDPFDLMLRFPEPLVPRDLRLCVQERIAASGDIVIPLDEQGVRQCAERLRKAGVQSIAIAFFNSYKNAAHEERAAQIVREVCPRALVSISAITAPEIREYQRFSTSVANAYIQPTVSSYLATLAEKLGTDLLIVLSHGGIASPEAAVERPIAMVESGPAAGVMGAAHLAKTRGWGDIIAFDMGGTTAKMSLVRDGTPEIVHELEVARIERLKKGSGLPVKIPVVELLEIGAGGGSIAWVDPLGLMKVGPRSAGASPGPACYGLGATDPTVTDADVHLGYIDPARFCGGRMTLDPDLSREALDRLGGELDMDATAVAVGIVEVVNNTMAAAAQVHVAEHGEDPRNLSIVAFGGAGPVHACSMARILRVPTVVFPRSAGVASAIGMLVAPRCVESSRSLPFALKNPPWDELESSLDVMRYEAQKLMRTAGVAAHEIDFKVSAEMRYRGQGYEINVPVPAPALSARNPADLVDAFQAEYVRKFDRVLDMDVECLSWRVRATAGPVVAHPESAASVTERHHGENGGSARPAPMARRSAYFSELGEFITAPVFTRSALKPGDEVAGAAIIEEDESTIVVGPTATVIVDDDGNIIMSIAYEQ